MAPTNEELLNSALNDEAPEAQPDVVEQSQPQANDEGGQPRDQLGRYAPQEQAVQGRQGTEAERPQQQPDAQGQERVPEYRREFINARIREALEENNKNWESRFDTFSRRFQPPAPQQQPQSRPDLYENPDGFVDHGVRQAVDPLKAELGQIREQYSLMFAQQQHGADKVKTAHDWLKQGMASGDGDAWSTYQRAMGSIDPYGEIVKSHQKVSVFQQIGSDPTAWFQKELEQKLADPKFAGEIMQKIEASVRNPQDQSNPQGRQIINMPPNMRRVPSAASASEDQLGMSNGDLLASAMR